MNLRLVFLLPLLAAAPALAQQFGEPLALAGATAVSEILADPAAFEGELVQVRGTVADVCPRAGCWVAIREEGGRQITFKVEDGAMVFTPDMKGRGIAAEGVVALTAPAPKAAEGHCGGGEDGGGDCGDCCEKGAAPPARSKPGARLDGVGAVVK